MELTQVHVRLLGCLVEKERTTPDDYPLTANALMRAANQATSRNPVVSYDLGLVESELATLKEMGLVRFVHSPSNRATKYRHVLDEVLGLDERATALLAVLFLRGDQTPGELQARVERLARFDSMQDVIAVLEEMAARSEPLVVQRERQPGQQQRRWGHRWMASPEPAATTAAEPPAGAAPAASPAVSSGAAVASAVEPSGLAGRVAELESEVARLRAGIAELREALGMEPEDAVTPPS